MSNAINPAAPHHLPPFITAPGETDYFYNGSAIFIVVMVIVLGSVYFRLHALPEHLAHDNSNKVQFQLVGVLALLALFTHNNVFWVAALLLALVRLPDLVTPLVAMAESLAKLAGRRRVPDPDASPKEEIIATSVPSASIPVAIRSQSVGNGSRQPGDESVRADVETAVDTAAALDAEDQAPSASPQPRGDVRSS